MTECKEPTCRQPSMVPWTGVTVILLALLGLILVSGQMVQAGDSLATISRRPAAPSVASLETSFGSLDDHLSVGSSATVTPTAFLPLVTRGRPLMQGMIAFERHATEDGPHDIWLMYHDGSGEENLTNSPGADDGVPTWSPDGSFLAFESKPLAPPGANRIIYKMDMRTRGVVPLTDGTYDDYWPAWSPSGDKIAFMREAGLPPDIYVMNVDGTDQAQLTDWTYGDDFPAWSPDGTKIAFSSNRDYAGRDLYVMRADGSNQQRLLLTAEQDELYPSWEPDGWIYYTFRVSKSPRRDLLYRMDPNTTNHVPVFNDEYNRYIASWAPDGQCFVFYSTMGDIAGTDKEVWKWCNGFTDPINLTNNDVGDEYAAWSPVP